MKNKSRKMKNKSRKIKNKPRSIRSKNRVYNKKDYISGDGMLTAVWGPGLWHYLHVISFNYPINPTQNQKTKYKQLLLNLQYTLPCKFCRVNLKNNFKKYPLNNVIFDNRTNFSKYMFNLHELINKLLKKKSNLSYCDVRDRYEHFRSRCTEEKPHLFKYKTLKREKGCTTPLYGKKSKCVLSIVPAEKKCKTLKIDKKCLKTKFKN
jgi:hypothetical protein